MANREAYITKYWNQREARTVILKFSDTDLDFTTALDLRLWCKRDLDGGTEYLFTKTSDNGNFTTPVEGKKYWVSFPVYGSELNFHDVAYCIFLANWSSTSRKKAIFKIDLARTPE